MTARLVRCPTGARPVPDRWSRGSRACCGRWVEIERAPHSGPECNQSAPKVIFPTFHFWHFLASLLKLTPLSTMYIYRFPLKFILYMEIFLSKLKFHSTFYKNMSFNTLCKFMIKIGVWVQYAWKTGNLLKIDWAMISKERWNYIINVHHLNFSKG